MQIKKQYSRQTAGQNLEFFAKEHNYKHSVSITEIHLQQISCAEMPTVSKESKTMSDHGNVNQMS
jgi:hypothetical protein